MKKTRTVVGGFIVFPAVMALLVLSCGSRDGFNIDTMSPSGEYRVQLSGKIDPPHPFPWESYAQTASLHAFQNSKPILEEEKFFREDSLDELFLQRFPVQEWFNSSTLRLGDVTSKEPFHDRLVVVNKSEQAIKLAIIYYDKYEMFLIFDLALGKQVELSASPQFSHGSSASMIFYRAYYATGSFSGNVQMPRRTNAADGPLTVPIELKD